THRKAVQKYIELKPVQNSNRLFYFLQSNETYPVALVYLYKEIYVQDYSCKIHDLDDPKTLRYQETFESWINGIPNNTYPSLLEIKLYKELGLDYVELERKRALYEFALERELKGLLGMFLLGKQITGSDFIRICQFKKEKIPPHVFPILGWQVVLMSNEQVHIKKGVEQYYIDETLNFIRKFEKKYRINQQISKEEIEEFEAKYSDEGLRVV
ncbi:MAG: hypothetical protein LIP06_14480, partial [Tannerellaceae bacterium]|nr:hypothetical protein [Tannerellaceae bacterium]